MDTKQYTIHKVEKAFKNFDKWETYGTAFEAMDKRQIRLKDIQHIAQVTAGIDPDVIAMRRLQWVKMK